MASLLSILKNVINLKRVHVEKQEIVESSAPMMGNHSGCFYSAIKADCPGRKRRKCGILTASQEHF